MKRFRFTSLHRINNKKHVLEKPHGSPPTLDIVASHRIIWKTVAGSAVWSAAGASSIPELGKQYQIGHTFFAEIVEIYKSYKEIGGYKSLQYQLFRHHGATDILWNISLEPMLVSFLGNMDLEVQNEILKDLKNIYNQK